MSTLTFARAFAAGKHSKRSPRRVAGTDWERKTVNIDRYRQVSLRLFGQSVSFQNGSESCFDRCEETQMLRNRRRVLRYYLREMRRDFVGLWSLCRRRSSGAAGKNLSLSKRLVDFFRVYSQVWLSSPIPTSQSSADGFNALVESLQSLGTDALTLQESTS
jgi:hypothetical protein